MLDVLTQGVAVVYPGAATRVAVVYTAPDLESLLASGLRFDAVIPLTPRASEALRVRGIPQIDTESGNSNMPLARRLVLTRRARRMLLKEFERTGVPESARFTFLYGYHGIAFGALRLYDALGHGPWLVPVGGVWKELTDVDEAADALAQHIIGSRMKLVNFPPYHAPPLLPLYRLLRTVVLKLVRHRGATIICARSEHPFGLEEELAAAKPASQQYLLAPASEGWREYLRLARELWRGRRGSFKLQARIVATDGAEAEMVADQIRAAFDSAAIDTRLHHALDILWPRLRPAVRSSAAFSSDLARVIREIQPDLFLSYEIADGFTAAVAAAAGAKGVTRLTLNHNANSPTMSGAAAELTRVLFDTQHDPALTDVFVFWTPSGAAAAKQFLPESKHAAIYPIERRRRDRSVTDAVVTGKKERVVLHAGNTQRWFRQFTWIFENSKETVKGLEELARAVAAVPSTRLLVRAKMRHWELDEDTLRVRLGAYGAFDLHPRAGTSFVKDLASADLLVSFSSTTIFDAIYARIPVLLWGGTMRYRRLPARTMPPTAADRAAVYSVEREQDLAPMIEAILAAHADRPLTDNEVGPYVWPVGTPDLTGLAKAIAGGDYRSAWQQGGRA